MIEILKFNYLNEQYIILHGYDKKSIYILYNNIYYRWGFSQNSWHEVFFNINTYKYIELIKFIRDEYCISYHIGFSMRLSVYGFINYIEIDKVEELRNIKNIICILE